MSDLPKVPTMTDLAKAHTHDFLIIGSTPYPILPQWHLIKVSKKQNLLLIKLIFPHGNGRHANAGLITASSLFCCHDLNTLVLIAEMDVFTSCISEAFLGKELFSIC